MHTIDAEAAIENRQITRSFRDLRVWDKAFTLTQTVHRLVDALPPAAARDLGEGMRETALAVTTQIAQGSTHSYSKDFLRCLDASLVALSDLETRVLLAGSLGYLDTVAKTEVEGLISEVRRMEWSLVNRLRAREDAPGRISMAVAGS